MRLVVGHTSLLFLSRGLHGHSLPPLPTSLPVCSGACVAPFLSRPHHFAVFCSMSFHSHPTGDACAGEREEEARLAAAQGKPAPVAVSSNTSNVVGAGKKQRRGADKDALGGDGGKKPTDFTNSAKVCG